MSRVGQATIQIPEGVEFKQSEKSFWVKGSKGELEALVSDYVEVSVKDNIITVSPKEKTSRGKALWGTTRALINSAVKGVTEGFSKDMEIVGVGYRGNLQGQKLSLSLGLSHPVEIDIPEGLSVKMDGNTKLAISSVNKQKLGQFCSVIRSKRPPEPFKGKGIRYADEYIIRKEGKKK